MYQNLLLKIFKNFEERGGKRYFFSYCGGIKKQTNKQKGSTTKPILGQFRGDFLHVLSAVLYPKTSFPLLSFFSQFAITRAQGCLHFLPNFSWTWGYSTHTQRPQSTCLLKCFLSRLLEISLALRLNWSIVQLSTK